MLCASGVCNSWTLSASRLCSRWDSFPVCFFLLHPPQKSPTHMLLFLQTLELKHCKSSWKLSHQRRTRNHDLHLPKNAAFGLMFHFNLRKSVRRCLPPPSALQIGGTNHSWDGYWVRQLPELYFMMLQFIFFLSVFGLYVESKNLCHKDSWTIFLLVLCFNET